MEEKKLDL